MPDRQDIRALSLPEIETLFSAWGEPRFRAKQLYEWLWSKCATDFDTMSNLSKELRTKLKDHFAFNTLYEDKTQHS